MDTVGSNANQHDDMDWVEQTVKRNAHRSDAAKVATQEQLGPQLQEQGLSPDYIDLFCEANRDLMRYFAGTGVAVTTEHLVSWLDTRENEAFRSESWTRDIGAAYKEAKRVAQSLDFPVIPAIE